MALINPIWPLDASFQFSFFVLLGILLTSGTISAWCARRMAWVRRHPRAAEALTLSLSAQITAMPIQLLFYGYVPLLALPVNAAAGGLMSVIMMGGIVCSVAGAFVPTVGRFIGGTLGWATGSAEALICETGQTGRKHLPPAGAVCVVNSHSHCRNDAVQQPHSIWKGQTQSFCGGRFVPLR